MPDHPEPDHPLPDHPVPDHPGPPDPEDHDSAAVETFVFPPGPLARSPSDVFRAVSHPARRAIIEHLADGPDEAGEIADAVYREVKLTWSSTSNHLRILLAAGIVTVIPWDSYRIYELRPDGLEPLRVWLEACSEPATSRPDFWFSRWQERHADGVG